VHSRLPRLCAAGLATLGLALAAPPAQAATQKCKFSATRVIKIPKQADLEVRQQTCVIRFPQANGSKFKAWVYTTWQRTGSGPILNKRVEDYIVRARLEFNQPGDDRNIEVAKCNITSAINRRPAGSQTCQTPVSVLFVDGPPEFTGDGTVIYDVNGDGKGNKRWDLDGSPRV
jgi:hypothetical protein